MVALLLTTLSLNAADTVTNGQTVARTKMVQALTSTQDVSVSFSPAATNITYAWELWNLGTNVITVTNGIAGASQVISNSGVIGLRAMETNQWRVIYKQP